MLILRYSYANANPLKYETKINIVITRQKIFGCSFKSVTFEIAQKFLIMKRGLLLLFVGLMAFSLNAQDTTAKIEFKDETIDYGEIAKNSDGVRVFEFTNTGSVPLVISNVKSSCGCTIPKKPDAPIMPGETGEIEVKYDTRRVGPIRKAITVTSNADTPTKVLKIKGTVLPEDSK